MRHLLVAMLLLGLVGSAFAVRFHLGETATFDFSKPESGVIGTAGARSGGEDMDTATLVTEPLPYIDAGTTIGYVDDYDAACPYSSGAPDAVYEWTVGDAGLGAVNIDVCVGDYDTKLFVLEIVPPDTVVVACNEDACNFQSMCYNVPIVAGHTYYIVVDGYGYWSGNYELNIEYWEPCSVPCPAGATLEGEPTIEADYDDVYNAGCNANGEFFYLCPDEFGDLVLCGNGGSFTNTDLTTGRDTDWYSGVCADSPVTVTLEADNAMYLFEMAFDPALRCADPSYGVYGYAAVSPCTPTTLVYTLAGVGDEIWVWIGDQNWPPPGDIPEYYYVATFTGLGGGPTATEETTWSAVKSMFR